MAASASEPPRVNISDQVSDIEDIFRKEMRYEGAPTHYRDEEKPHIVPPFLKRIDALTGRRFRMGCKWPSHYNMRLADSQIMKLLPIRSSLFVNRGSIKD